MITNYYDILGIEKTATDKEIKSAFRKLAHKYHPDKGGDEKKFKKVNEAYQTLSNKEKKINYDSFGSSSSAFGNVYGFNGGGNEGFHMNYKNFSQTSPGARSTVEFFRKLPKWAWMLLMPIIIVVTFISIIMVLLWISFRTFQSAKR